MRISPLVLLACYAAAPSALLAEVVHIDGIVRVKDGSWRGVKLTVVPEFSEPFEVDLRSDRFDLMLPLYATYLLRAEHAGCPTKEVLFDCTVPPAFWRTSFEFPIEIGLVVESARTMFVYAGPVGLVTFDQARADFTYTTDYTRIKNVRPLPDLHARMPASALAGGTGPDPLAAAFASLMGQASSGVADTPGVVPVADHIPPVESDRLVAEDVFTASINVVPVDGPAMHIVPSLRTTVVMPTAPVARAKPVAVRTVVKPPIPLVPTRDERPCGTHDIVWQAHCVIRIDRLPTPDGCSELRKVVHAYGAIFFFHDGRAVTEPYYQNALTAQH